LLRQKPQGRLSRACATPIPSTSHHEDAGVSGSIALENRPPCRMLKDAREGDCVIAVKMDRLFPLPPSTPCRPRGSENPRHRPVLIDMGVEPVTFQRRRQNVFRRAGAAGRVRRERILQRTADGRKAKLKKSGHCGGPPPFGFSVRAKARKSLLVTRKKRASDARRHGAPSGRTTPGVGLSHLNLRYEAVSSRPGSAGNQSADWDQCQRV